VRGLGKAFRSNIFFKIKKLWQRIKNFYKKKYFKNVSPKFSWKKFKSVTKNFQHPQKISWKNQKKTQKLKQNRFNKF
jgi:hypothetical protein